MEGLKQRILKDGKAKAEGGIVLVNGFLNHQLDPQLLMHCAEEPPWNWSKYDDLMKVFL